MSSETQQIAIQQFLILLKDQSAAVVEKVVERILADTHIFVFGEFLALPNVKSLPKDCKTIKTLELFAYGSYSDFKGEESAYLSLNERHLKKLKMISVAELSTQSKLL